MRKKLIFILCISLLGTVGAQTLSPATVGQRTNVTLNSNDKSLSYGVNHISITPSNASPSIPNTRSANKKDFLNVYPNPASSNLLVGLHFEGEGIAYCLIYNSWGKKITDFNAQIDASGTVTKQLDISMLPTGNYLLSMIYTPVKGGSQTLTEKFEVIH